MKSPLHFRNLHALAYHIKNIILSSFQDIKIKVYVKESFYLLFCIVVRHGILVRGTNINYKYLKMIC